MTKIDDRQNLHPTALVQLFQHSLYLIGEKPAEQQKSQIQDNPQQPPSAGQYKKGILLLVSEASVPLLADEEFDLLTKILTASKLSMADVQLMNLHGFLPYNMPALMEQNAPRVVIMFGVKTEEVQLPMRFPDFQVQPWGQTTFLTSPSLSIINGQTQQALTLKKQLWQALQRIFLA